MNRLIIAKKLLAFMMCAAISAGLITAFPNFTGNSPDVSARTIAEIQQERDQNNEKIAEYEAMISSLEGDKQNEQEYQENLAQQIALIQNNIVLLNEEIDKLGSEIELTEQNIERLDRDIEIQQQEIEKNIELFKERLCDMYISGNDNLASILLGSASFYDMMSRVEMVNRMAEYDEELITTLLGQIDQLDKTKKDLNTERAALEAQLKDQQNKKDEKADDILTLNQKMAKTTAIIENIKAQQEMIQLSKEEKEQLNLQLQKEEEEMQAEIKRNAELAQQRYEEEQRRILEEQREAERRAAEEKAEAERIAAQQQAEAEQNSAQQEQQQNDDTSSESYDEEETDTTEENSEPEQTTEISIPAPSASGFVWPVPGYYFISSYFGSRSLDYHKGIDVGDAGIMGAPVVASKSGLVTNSCNTCTHNYGKSTGCGCGQNYGNFVMLQHDGTYTTVYGHMTNIVVSTGDYVQQGQIIGYVGTTGWSTGPHLHFEVRVDGLPTDPFNFVSP